MLLSVLRCESHKNCSCNSTLTYAVFFGGIHTIRLSNNPHRTSRSTWYEVTCCFGHSPIWLCTGPMKARATICALYNLRSSQKKILYIKTTVKALQKIFTCITTDVKYYYYYYYFCSTSCSGCALGFIEVRKPPHHAKVVVHGGIIIIIIIISIK